MSSHRFLTGITPSGTPHLGNYVGAIRPSVLASQRADVDSFYFLADYHALIKSDDPARIQRSTLEIAASWLAAGLEPQRVTFYRQSDIPEIAELTWLLTCVTSKGLLNRAHAYKAAVDQNAAAQQEPDHEVNAGLFMYPVLMAADILAYQSNTVPVGQDQKQHVEVTRDIAMKFNNQFGPVFTIPEPSIRETVAVVPGIDGRKMSKSYDNHIELFGAEKATRARIMRIVTDSTPMESPKDPDKCNVYALYRLIASPEEANAMAQHYRAGGYGYGQAKKALADAVVEYFKEFRTRREELRKDLGSVEEILRKGAEVARHEARKTLDKARKAVGIA